MKLIDIYLHSDINAEIKSHGKYNICIYYYQRRNSVILLIASFNFINLSTVRSIQRSKEVGLKKVSGPADRNSSGSLYLWVILCNRNLTFDQHYSLPAVEPGIQRLLGFKLAVPSYLNYNFLCQYRLVIIAVCGFSLRYLPGILSLKA